MKPSSLLTTLSTLALATACAVLLVIAPPAAAHATSVFNPDTPRCDAARAH